MYYELIRNSLRGYCADIPLMNCIIRLHNVAGINVESLPMMQQHDYYQIILTLRGDVSITLDGQEIQMHTGSLLFTNHKVPHSNPTYISDQYEYIVLLFEIVENTEVHTYRNKACQIWEQEEKQLLTKVLSQPYIHLHKAYHCLHHAQILEDALGHMYIGDYITIRNLIANLFISMLQTLYKHLDELPPMKMDNSSFSSPICMIYEYISRHCSEPLHLNDIAELVAYSPRHLQRLIKTYYGVSFTELLLNLRIYKAKSLLRNTSLPLSDVCTLCGISDESAFHKSFKDIVGVTPSEFRAGL